MSYGIEFQKNGETCILPFPPPHGGTYCADEDFRKAWFNITFNYAQIFARHGLSIVKREKTERGIRTLEGKTATECVRILTSVIPKMGNETDPDYWEPPKETPRKHL